MCFSERAIYGFLPSYARRLELWGGVQAISLLPFFPTVAHHDFRFLMEEMEKVFANLRRCIQLLEEQDVRGERADSVRGGLTAHGTLVDCSSSKLGAVSVVTSVLCKW